MENIFTLKGTLYSRDCRKVKNSKKPTEPDWEFYSIRLETKLSLNGREMTKIPELHLDKGVTYDGHNVGDTIECDCYLDAKQISSTWLKTDVKCCFIKGDPNKVKPKADGFTAPPTPNEKRQTEQSDNNDDGLGDLPF